MATPRRRAAAAVRAAVNAPGPEGDDEVAPDSGLAQTLSRGAPPEPVAEAGEKSDNR